MKVRGLQSLKAGVLVSTKDDGGSCVVIRPVEFLELRLIELQKQLYRIQEGSVPTEKQLYDFIAKERNDHLRGLAIDYAEVAQYAETKPEDIFRRQAEIYERIAKRSIRPADYTPPGTIGEVVGRISAGESYFAYADIDCTKSDSELPLDLEGCNFTGSHLSNLNHGKSVLFANVAAREAKLSSCYFGNLSTLDQSDFRDAKFHNVTVAQNASLSDASFEGVSFSGHCEIPFDQNLVIRSNFRTVKSDWSRIYLAFTGTQQFVSIAFVFGYFLLLLIKISALKAISELQEIIENAPGLRSMYATVFQTDSNIPVWKLALGGATPTFVSLSIAVLILVYQVERYRITISISPMIEGLKIDGYTPKRSAYQALAKRVYVNSLFGLLALVAFILDYSFALLREIDLPSPSLLLPPLGSG